MMRDYKRPSDRPEKYNFVLHCFFYCRKIWRVVFLLVSYHGQNKPIFDICIRFRLAGWLLCLFWCTFTCESNSSSRRLPGFPKWKWEQSWHFYSGNEWEIFPNKRPWGAPTDGRCYGNSRYVPVPLLTRINKTSKLHTGIIVTIMLIYMYITDSLPTGILLYI